MAQREQRSGRNGPAMGWESLPHDLQLLVCSYLNADEKLAFRRASRSTCELLATQYTVLHCSSSCAEQACAELRAFPAKATLRKLSLPVVGPLGVQVGGGPGIPARWLK